MYKIALFDLDGTLTNPKEGITKSVQYALASFGINVADLNELTKFIGPPLRDSFQEYYDFSTSEAETAVAKYREYFSERGIFENTLYKGIPELLGSLQKNNICLAVATSKPTVYARKIVNHFRLDSHFKLIVGSELNGNRSRKSEVIQYTLDILDIKNTVSAVMVGDREHDIIGANEVGIDSIGVKWGYGSHGELGQAGATAIAETPDELFRLIIEESK